MNKPYLGIAALVGVSLFSGCRVWQSSAYVRDVNGDGRNDVVEERNGVYSVWIAQADGSLVLDNSIDARVEEGGVVVRQSDGSYTSIDEFPRIR